MCNVRNKPLETGARVAGLVPEAGEARPTAPSTASQNITATPRGMPTTPVLLRCITIYLDSPKSRPGTSTKMLIL